MIKFKFFINGENISGFSVTGHAGYDVSGKDIVCAAVSSAAYMAVNTVTDIINAKAEASAEESGAMSFELFESSDEAQAVLRGLELHIESLAVEYPGRIKVIYGGVKNA